MRFLPLFALFVGLLAVEPLAAAPRAPIEIGEGLFVEQPGVSRREPLHSDAIEAAIVAGSFRWPSEGDLLTLPDGKKLQWKRVEADEKGELRAERMRGGYVAVSVHSTERRIALLEAKGHAAVRHDGAWRMGDHYGYGWLAIPVKLRKGENRFLFRVGRAGSLRASLLPATAPLILETRDPTFPDVVVGRSSREVGAVVVLNASDETVTGATLTSQLAGGRKLRTPVSSLPPLGSVKVPMAFEAAAPREEGDLPLEIELASAGGATSTSASYTIRARRPDQVRWVSYRSEIDGSVQHYGMKPAWPDSKVPGPKALIFSTHGAGVQGIGQANAYAAKSWAHVVGPTNRRRYGFDWEDWGRWEAMEALAHARETLGTDPYRQYLSGHSMGGHGAWHLGVTFPDQWALVGPSAGWLSFRSYAGSEQVEHASKAAEILDRAWKPSDTLALFENLDRLAVYVLHGADDDNVPPTEARRAQEELEKREHPDFHYHEEPGKGHWWNLHDEPGADCVDWQPMLDLMARRSIPPAPRVVTFNTAHPAVSSRSHWLEIVSVERSFEPARVEIRHDPIKRRFAGTTNNVSRLALDLDILNGEGEIGVELDGRSFTVGAVSGERLLLERRGEDWAAVGSFPTGDKHPERCGPFREAFRNRALLVYGTRGTQDENAWALARARFDQEQFRYRGNGSFDTIADTAFRPEQHPDRNVVLYGGRHVNAAWDSLLANSPVVVERDGVRIGGKRLRAADLAVLFIRPRPGSDSASVGVVAGTGLPGARLTERIPYFVSGIAFPDLTVLDSTSLSRGVEGLRAAGFFGRDWGLESGEIAIER